ncbi:caveolin-3-like [Liolophura sinensis]|uniref:caveolin-3-like n=1 Tax=Liolophura sinensis TaxID=3198878 RepID=UPI003158C368
MSDAHTPEQEVKLTVDNDEGAAEEVMKSQEITIGDRDPNRMNDHVKIAFTDIIGEPDPGVHSFDKIWLISFKVFSNTKLWCYRITTLILGLPLSVIWGVYFACLAFCNIWICEPCIKSFFIELNCFRRIWEIILTAFYRPCFEAMGRCLSFIKIGITKD